MMKRLFRKLPQNSLLILILLASPTLTSFIESKTNTVCESEECLAAAEILEQSMDTTDDPCDDFYQYACGKWPQYHKTELIPISSMDLRSKQNEKEILEFLQQNNTQDEPETVHKARQLYKMCLDPKSYDGIEQLKDILTKIGLPIVPISNETANFDYVSSLAKASKMAGIMMYFSVLVSNHPLNHSLNAIRLVRPLPVLDYTVMPSNRQQRSFAAEILSHESNFTNKVFEKMCANAPFSNCTSESSNLKLNIIQQDDAISALVGKRKSKLNSTRIPTIHTLEELQNITDQIADEVKPSIPRLNWTKYIEELFDGIEDVTLDLTNTSNVQIVIHQINLIRDLIRYMYERNITEIEHGLWWKTVSALLPLADFEVFGAKRSKPLNDSIENGCYKIVTKAFEKSISYMYLKKENHTNAKIEVDNMLKYITESYKKIFEQSSWMDEKSREKALTKLASMQFQIAYPNSTELLRILNENEGKPNVQITRSLFGTIMTVLSNEMEQNLNKITKINNQTSQNWDMTPITVNGGYDVSNNEITIPAGLLGPPLYTNSLKALMYGSLGFVAAHEMSHGFDYDGRKYNSMGVPEDWWKNETSVKYEEKIRCFLEAYNNYESNFESYFQKVNSSLTLDEDTADNAGFKAALFAYRSYVSDKGIEPSLKRFENYTSEQLFTLGFANFFCESPTIISMLLTIEMDHSPSGVRVNGVLKNSHEFSAIWNCPKGSNMNPSDEKCSLW